MKKQLNVSSIVTGTGHNKTLDVSRITANTSEMPNSCVVFPDGLCVEAPFAHHSDAFALGSNIYFAENGIDGAYATSDELYELLSDVIKDGVVDLSFSKILDDDRYRFIVHSIFGYGSVRRNLQNEQLNDKQTELINIIDSTMWIGSSKNWSKPNDLIKQVAKNWLIKNGHIIWIYRVLYLMLSSAEFFDENNYDEWFERLQVYNVTLPSEIEIRQKASYSLNHRSMELAITDCFADGSLNQFQDVIWQLATMRQILGYPSQQNHYELACSTDLDKYVCQFLEPTLTPHQQATLPLLEEIVAGKFDDDDRLVIVDATIHSRIDIPLSQFVKMTVNPKQSYLAIDFIAPPATRLLRVTTTKERLVKGFTIDDCVSLSVNRKKQNNDLLEESK